MLLVDRDARSAGDYHAPGSLAGMIKQAWCSAWEWMPDVMTRWHIFRSGRRCGWNAMMSTGFQQVLERADYLAKESPKLTAPVSATLAAVVAEPDRRLI
ncbi:hypothetical protein ACVCEA_17425 [Escherichia coli]